MSTFTLSRPDVNRKLSFGPDGPAPVRLTEKYRPATLDHVLGQDDAVYQLKAYVASPFPNAFIFEGPTGVGKTTCARALANDLGCDRDWAFDEIGSAKGGVDDVERSLKQLRFSAPNGGWRMLLVDEADSMTSVAKTLLLSALEDLPSRSVVIFTTNHPERFGDRFLDRCDRITFASDCGLMMDDAQTLVNRVWQGETGETTGPDVATLPNVCQDGSMSFRRVVNAVASALHVRSRLASVATPVVEPTAPVAVSDVEPVEAPLPVSGGSPVAVPATVVVIPTVEVEAVKVETSRPAADVILEAIEAGRVAGCEVETVYDRASRGERNRITRLLNAIGFEAGKPFDRFVAYVDECINGVRVSFPEPHPEVAGSEVSPETVNSGVVADGIDDGASAETLEVPTLEACERIAADPTAEPCKALGLSARHEDYCGACHRHRLLGIVADRLEPPGRRAWIERRTRETIADTEDDLAGLVNPSIDAWRDQFGRTGVIGDGWYDGLTADRRAAFDLWLTLIGERFPADMGIQKPGDRLARWDEFILRCVTGSEVSFPGPIEGPEGARADDVAEDAVTPSEGMQEAHPVVDFDRQARIDAWKARKAARIARLRDRAERAEREAAARFNSHNVETLRGMAGEPIKIGHHSERRHRALIERADNDMRKGCEAMGEARQLGRRADAAERNDAIDSRDPEALDLLRGKLAGLEDAQASMKTINAVHKRFLKDPASLEGSKLSEAARGLVRAYKPAYSWEPHPFPPYRLSNAAAEVRRVKERIAELEERAATVARPEVVIDGVSITEDDAYDAVHLLFSGKPDEATRSRLKAEGFRWARSLGVWTRRRSNRTTWILERLFPGYADAVGSRDVRGADDGILEAVAGKET